MAGFTNFVRWSPAGQNFDLSQKVVFCENLQFHHWSVEINYIKNIISLMLFNTKNCKLLWTHNFSCELPIPRQKVILNGIWSSNIL